MISGPAIPISAWRCRDIRSARLIFLVGALLLQGCASSQFYQTQNDSLVLSLKHKGAGEVLFYSSADNFQPRQAISRDGTLWRVSVPAQDEFSYFFTVDGKRVLPDCRLRETDDFGSQNCLYVQGM